MKMERTGSGIVIAAVLLVFGWASAAGAQTPAGFGARIPFSSSGLVAAGSREQGGSLREIDDPHTGARWLLVRNEQNPGGPGRLVLIGVDQKKTDKASGQGAGVEARTAPVIFAGDRLVVEEHTARADAVLEARALSSAASGVEFNARLTIGGRVVRAVALGPGHAALRLKMGAER